MVDRGRDRSPRPASGRVPRRRIFFFQAEDGIRDLIVLEFRRVLFRSSFRQCRCTAPIAAPGEVFGGYAVATPGTPAATTRPKNRLHCAPTHTHGASIKYRQRAKRKIGRASCRERV